MKSDKSTMSLSWVTVPLRVMKGEPYVGERRVSIIRVWRKITAEQRTFRNLSSFLWDVVR